MVKASFPAALLRSGGRDERGQALIVALVSLMVLIISAATVTVLITSNQDQSSNQRQGAGALSAADAGLDLAANAVLRRHDADEPQRLEHRQRQRGDVDRREDDSGLGHFVLDAHRNSCFAERQGQASCCRSRCSRRPRRTSTTIPPIYGYGFVMGGAPSATQYTTNTQVDAYCTSGNAVTIFGGSGRDHGADLDQRRLLRERRLQPGDRESDLEQPDRGPHRRHDVRPAGTDLRDRRRPRHLLEPRAGRVGQDHRRLLEPSRGGEGAMRQQQPDSGQRRLGRLRVELHADGSDSDAEQADLRRGDRGEHLQHRVARSQERLRRRLLRQPSGEPVRQQYDARRQPRDDGLRDAHGRGHLGLQDVYRANSTGAGAASTAAWPPSACRGWSSSTAASR